VLESLVLPLSYLDRLADSDQPRNLPGKGSAAVEADDLARLARKPDVQVRKVRAETSARLDWLPLPAIAVMRDDTFMQVSPTKALVFPRLVKLAAFDIKVDNKRVPLATGFAAIAGIKPGERRIVEFLLSPLSRRLQEAGREG